MIYLRMQHLCAAECDHISCVRSGRYVHTSMLINVRVFQCHAITFIDIEINSEIGTIKYYSLLDVNSNY